MTVSVHWHLHDPVPTFCDVKGEQDLIFLGEHSSRAMCRAVLSAASGSGLRRHGWSPAGGHSELRNPLPLAPGLSPERGAQRNGGVTVAALSHGVLQGPACPSPRTNVTTEHLVPGQPLPSQSHASCNSVVSTSPV